MAWDASALLHASRSDRLDVLLFQVDAVAPNSGHVTTAAVAQEVARRGGTLPSRIEIVHVDGLEELTELVVWLDVLGSGEHNRGEATICAWASVNGAIVVMDDAEAVRVARGRGLQVLRTLGVCAEAVQRGAETLAAASAMLDAMMADGARYPFGPGGFPGWFERNPPS